MMLVLAVFFNFGDILMDKSSFAIYFPIFLVKLGISVVSRCLSGC